MITSGFDETCPLTAGFGLRSNYLRGPNRNRSVVTPKSRDRNYDHFRKRYEELKGGPGTFAD